MKTGITALFISICVLAFSQVPELSEITEETRFMSQGENNAFTVNIPNTSIKMAEDTWEKYVKQFKGKTKQDKRSKEYFSDDCELTDLSQNTVDVYARFGESSTGTVTAHVWFDLGGMYVSSAVYPEKGQAAKTHLQTFSRFVAKNEAIAVMEAEEKLLRDMERDLDKLAKENEGYHKKIESAKELILKMETSIEENLTQQENKQAEIKAQLDALNSAKANVQKYN